MALFSSFIVNEKEGKAFYIKSYLVKKDLYTFSIPEIDMIILKQIILFRILNMGTIILHKKTGEQIKIVSLKNVSSLYKRLTVFKNGGTENA
jgi:hypothetical protein